MTHTPGPWTYRPHQSDDWGFVRDSNTNNLICQAKEAVYLSPEELWAHRRAGTDPAEANARLIAAAPDLLEACRAALNMVEGDGLPPDWDLIRAAIAKAEEK